MVSKKDRETNYLDHLKDFEIIVSSPASLLLFGEYSVLKEQPSLAMAIPLNVVIGASLTDNTDISFEFAYPEPDLNYAQLKSYANHDAVIFRENIIPGIQIRHIIDLFKQKLGNKGLKVRIISEIPPQCGLGSSGALCAALSVVIHCLINNNPSEINSTLNETISNIQTNELFDEIFKFAWELEDLFHKPSSGVAPFISLVGCKNELPLLFASKNTNTEKNYGALCLTEGKSIKLDNLKSFFWERCEFAAVYSGDKRKDATSAFVESTFRKIEKRVKGVVHRFNVHLGDIPLPHNSSLLFDNITGDSEKVEKYINDSIWTTFGLITLITVSNILTEDILDIINMTWIAQDFLTFLETSTPRIGEISTKARSLKLGCKLLGSGKGGDILMISRKGGLESLIKEIDDAIDSGKTELYIHYLSSNKGCPSVVNPTQIKIKGIKDYSLYTP